MDGIGATAMAMKAMKYFGAKVKYHIPHRVKQGYGLSPAIVDVVYSERADLIITFDNGIAAVEAINKANELGIKVIVTDHHDIPDVLPNAEYIINAKLPNDTSKNKALCGCQIGWKLMYRICEILEMDTSYIYNLLGIVAFSTIADLVELTPENRIMVKEGLRLANQKSSVGITALQEVLKIKEIKAVDVSFSLAVACNADGRIEAGIDAAELLMTDDKEKAMKLAEVLKERNEKRKELTKFYYEECLDYILKNKLENDHAFVIVNDKIPEGLIGLVAGKIKERFQKPSFVFAKAEEGYKASGRGVEGHPMHLGEALNATKGIWHKGGGHQYACGLSIKSLDLIEEFRLKVNSLSEKLVKEHGFNPTLNLDGIVNEPKEELCVELQVLEPTGKGNPPAILGTDSLNLIEAKPIGDLSHISFKIEGKKKAVGFGLTYLYSQMGNPNKLKFAYTPEINEYSFINDKGSEVNVRGVQMLVKDFELPESMIKRDKTMLISSIKTSLNK